MVNDGRHFSSAVFDEDPLGAIEFEEETRFRFRIDIECALEGVLALELSDQLVAFTPDCELRSLGKHGARRKLVLADDSIKKLCVQLDGDVRFG